MKNKNKTPYQEAVETTGQDVIVVANAGTGKTHLLVQHYFQLLTQGVDPYSIVAFTFTEKAALELKERILATLDQHEGFEHLSEEILKNWRNKIQEAPIGTIHQFCLKILEQSGKFSTTLHIIDEATEIHLREQILNRSLQEKIEQDDAQIQQPLKIYGIGVLRKILREWISKYDSIPPQAFFELPPLESLEAELMENLEKLARPIWLAIQKEKQKNHWFSFEDLEIQAVQALQNPSAPLQQYIRGLAHILVDEFQDTSPIQIALLEALRKNPKSEKPQAKLYCVGDPKQSIYRFRRVEHQLIEKTEAKLLAEGGKKFDFTRNYRSTAQVLELVNAFSQKAFPQALPSQAHREDFLENSVQLLSLGTEGEKMNAETYREEEAKWLIQRIQKLQSQGHALEKVGVLFRASGAASTFVKTLKKAGIPFTLRGGRDLFQRQEIRDLKNLLFFLQNPQDNLALIGMLRSPLFLISDATLYFLTQSMKKDEVLWERLKKRIFGKNLTSQEISKLTWIISVLEQLQIQAKHQSPSTLLREFIGSLDLERLYGEIDATWETPLAMEQFVTWLQSIEKDFSFPDFFKIVGFLKQLQQTPVAKAPLGDLMEGKGCLQLLTIHAAKGLQFKTVFLIGLSRPTPPDGAWIQHWGGELALKIPKTGGEIVKTPRFQAIQEYHQAEQWEENKRLLYVALTRAQNQLFVPLAPGASKAKNLQNLLVENLAKWIQPAEKLREVKDKIKAQPITAPTIPLPPWKPQENPWSTVSELETFATCPLKHHYAFQKKISDQKWDDIEPLSQTEMGTLLHQALNQLHRFPEQNVDEVLERLLQTQSLWNQEAGVAEFSKHLENYLNSPLYQAIQTADEDYSELPFLLQYEGGKIRGQIDRLFYKNSHWTLVDFKFTKQKKDLLKRYGFQLKTYALAGQRFLKGVLPKVEIHLLASLESYEFNFSSSELEQHERQLIQLLSQLGQTDLSQVQKQEYCYQCPYHQIVPVCPIPREVGKSLQESSRIDFMKP